MFFEVSLLIEMYQMIAYMGNELEKPLFERGFEF